MDITNSDDMIDVRDVIQRFEELEEERQALVEAAEEAKSEYDSFITGMASEEIKLEEAVTDAFDALRDWDASAESDECTSLKSLLDDLKGCGGDHQYSGDWYPVSLIRDSYFEEAMDEMLEDIGDMPKNILSYLKITVDYDALQMDYSSVEFDGVTYWYR